MQLLWSLLQNSEGAGYSRKSAHQRQAISARSATRALQQGKISTSTGKIGTTQTEGSTSVMSVAMKHLQRMRLPTTLKDMRSQDHRYAMPAGDSNPATRTTMSWLKYARIQVIVFCVEMHLLNTNSEKSKSSLEVKHVHRRLALTSAKDFCLFCFTFWDQRNQTEFASN